MLEHAVILTDGISIRGNDLRFSILRTSEAEEPETHLTLLEVEQRHITRVLREEQGHVERAAARLGIPRSSLYQKIKKLQID